MFPSLVNALRHSYSCIQVGSGLGDAGSWSRVTREVGGARRVLGLVACSLVLGAGCYDGNLLRRVAPSDGHAGSRAGGAGGAGGVGGGSGGAAAGAGKGGATGVSGASSPGDVATSAPRCGDGRVDAGERCDTGIPAELAGACPTQCAAAAAACGGQELVGTGCDAACAPITYACSSGDGCCPASCTASDDDDCSASCGDGVVQADAGETCEPGTDTPCPHEAECDDGDACTTDALAGSEANCNAECTHVDITALAGGDGCCPAGANANNDTDCQPKCGNGALESGEECDAGDGCDEQCKLTETPEQLHCLTDFPADDCRRCECIECTPLALDCFDSGDATRDMNCTAIESCGREMNCANAACYCGDSLNCEFPTGPCVVPIEIAAGSTLALTVNAMAGDPATAIYRANTLATCSIQSCSDVCP